MTENEEKKLQKIRESITHLKHQEQAILAREKNRQQKQKARRLIKNGALAEKYLNCEGMNPTDFEKLLKQLSPLEEVQNFLKNL